MEWESQFWLSFGESGKNCRELGKAQENFYVIVGSSAGALIGLQFVVITLVANMPSAPGEAQAGSAFAQRVKVEFDPAIDFSALNLYHHCPVSNVQFAPPPVSCLISCGSMVQARCEKLV